MAEKTFVLGSRGELGPQSLRCPITDGSGKGVVCPSASRCKREICDALRGALVSVYVAIPYLRGL